MTIHPNVRKFNRETMQLSFQPPLDQCKIMKYKLDNVMIFPFRGYYQMKEISNTETKVLIQLKLDENINNQFNYCRLIIPFSKRKRISNVHEAVTTGTIFVREDRTAIIWDIGQKFTGRNREVAFGPATVMFEEEEIDVNEEDDPEYDQFITGSNCYVQLSFQILDCSLSGLKLEERNIQVRGNNGSFTPKYDRSVVSNYYLIWNSFGQTKFVEQI